MRLTSRTLALLFAALAVSAGPALAADTPAPAATKVPDAPATAATKAQTKVSEADARKTAMRSVPNSSVQNAKLVTDKGRQVWSMEVKSETSPVIVVQVDADSGRIVSKSVKKGAAAPNKAGKS
jgi:uncharacterized membrane protein YkoI